MYHFPNWQIKKRTNKQVNMLTGHVVVNDYASTADCNWTELHPVPPVCQAGTLQIHVQRLHQEWSKLPPLL